MSYADTCGAWIETRRAEGWEWRGTVDAFGPEGPFHCRWCGKYHAQHDLPGKMCGWCLRTVEKGTRHHPTLPFCSCQIEVIQAEGRR